MAYTKVRSSHTGKEVVERSQKIRAEFANDAAVFAENPEFLGKFNIAMDQSQVETWNDQFGAAMDAIPNMNTSPSIPTANRYLQTILPGLVYTVTAPLTIERLIGVSTVGEWHDSEIIQPVMEHVGSTLPYSDLGKPYTNASWNLEYERRTVVRFEAGFQVTKLEQARAGAAGFDTAAEKRAAMQHSMELMLNRVGFYGYNDGANRTYGYLNDPNLPAYENVPNFAGGAGFINATYDELVSTINGWLHDLRISSLDRVNVDTDPLNLDISSAAVDAFNAPNQFGQTVREWLSKTHPNVTIRSTFELTGVNGGKNVAYLYAESVPGSGTDNGKVIDFHVQTRYAPMNSEIHMKGYSEGATMASSGVMCKRPYALKRFSNV